MPASQKENQVPESLIGLMVDGRYEINAKLGEGGIGAVFLARDRRMMDRPVVIKILLENWLDNPEIRRKFEHEKEALSRLDHPGIVSILDAGTLPGNKPYLVMPFAPGLTLEQMLKQDPTPPFEFCADVIEAIADALGAAHAKGVLHRDIKPENIIVDHSPDKNTRVRVIDFGIARVFDSQVSPVTHVERSIGTVWFVAPEQLLGSLEQTTAADIFSLGVITYLMLTGQRPFDPRTIVEMAILHKEGPKRAPSQINSALSKEVDDLVALSLQYDPAKRPGDVAKFGKAMAGALRRLGNPTSPPVTVGHARPSPTLPSSDDELSLQKSAPGIDNAKTWLPSEALHVPRPHRPPRHRAWLPAAVAGGLLLLLIGVAAAGYFMWRPAPPPEVETAPVAAADNRAPAEPSPPASSLRISFMLQGKDDPIPRRVDVTGVQRVSFLNNERITISVQPNHEGNLYVFNEDDLGRGQVEFNLLFPRPDFKEGIPRIAAMETNDFSQAFTGGSGVETVWFIWSSRFNRDLEEARSNAFKNKGKVMDSYRADQLRKIIAGYSADKIQISRGEGETIVGGNDDPLIYRVELEHR
jgi:serine/threonine protein kinase